MINRGEQRSALVLSEKLHDVIDVTEGMEHEYNTVLDTLAVSIASASIDTDWCEFLYGSQSSR